MTTPPAPLSQYPIPCVGCGYDLRATPLDGFCTECGTPVIATRGSGIRVDGKYVVVRTGVTLPHYCIKSGEPADDEPRSKKLYWMHPAWLLTLIVNWLITLVLYLLLRQCCDIRYFMNKPARRRYITYRWMGGGLWVGGLAMALAAVFDRNFGQSSASAILFAAGLIMFLLVPLVTLFALYPAMLWLA